MRRILELRLGAITTPALCPGVIRRPAADIAPSSAVEWRAERPEERAESASARSGMLSTGGTNMVEAEPEPETELPGIEPMERPERIEGAGGARPR